MTTTLERTDKLGLTHADIEALAAAVRGAVLQPGDAEYDTVCANDADVICRCPRLIVRCLHAADIVAAITFARAHHLPVAVRGGSHDVADFAVRDGGLVVDLSAMRKVGGASARYQTRIEGGALWGDFDVAGYVFACATVGA